MAKRNLDNENSTGSGKRICVDNPSRVLHIRNVSSDVSERDIANLAIPFGLISYLVLTRKTGQSLMEMHHEESAQAMVDYYSKCSPQFYGKNLAIQFSRYETLSGNGMHPDAEIAVKAANEDVRKLCEGEPKLVLHVTVENWVGTRLGHLHFYKLFHKFGTICRIIVFVQNHSPQALIEYENEVAAHVAKLQLSGSNSFYGHPVRIEFSTRKTLDIKHESETGRDYTISPVRKEELNPIPNFSNSYSGNLINNINDNNDDSPNANYNQHGDYPMGRPGNAINSNNSQMTAAEALAMLQPLLHQASTNPSETLPMLQSLAPTLTSLLNQTQMGSGGHQRDGGPIGPGGAGGHRMGGMSGGKSLHHGNGNCVVIVANLNEERISPDALFILFGVYGDVQRVKILYNKKNTALIQFSDPEHAARAVMNLNNVNLFEKPMRVNFSKHNSISMPKAEEQKSAHLNKDFSNSRLHRFKRASSRTVQNIYPPGTVLHLAGLPDLFEEDDVRSLFDEFCVTKIKMINPNQRKMALVQLDNVDMAVEALIKLHDHDVGGTKLKVSFSKGFIAN